MIVDAEPIEGSTTDLVREAISNAKELARLEIALAKSEAKDEILALKRSALSFGTAALCAILGLTFLLMTIAIATMSWVYTLLVGILFVVIGGAAAVYGVLRLPKKPLSETRQRMGSDLQVIKERLAS